MINDNVYSGQPRFGRDVVTEMRNINALQQRVWSFQFFFGSFGSGIGQFIEATALAIDSSDNIYVVDLGNDRIQKFDDAGTFIRQWGTTGAGDGDFDRPFGIAIDSNDRIIVADIDNFRVQIFDKDGVFITEFGSFGTGDGEFTLARFVAIDSQDNIYVTDSALTRIQKFDSDGNFILKWTSAVNSHQDIFVEVVNGTELVYVVFGGAIPATPNHILIYDVLGNLVETSPSLGRFVRSAFPYPNGRVMVGLQTPVVFDIGFTLRDSEFNDLVTVGAVPFLTTTFAQCIRRNSQDRIFFLSTRPEANPPFSNTRIDIYEDSQTAFSKYTRSTQTSLGTPDAGISIPALDALDNPEADVVPNHITDMRTALETLAPNFLNPDTSNPYDFDDLSADNLYRVATGTRSERGKDFGGNLGIGYTWVRTLGEMENSPTYDIDILEIALCVDQLEASTAA